MISCLSRILHIAGCRRTQKSLIFRLDSMDGEPCFKTLDVDTAEDSVTFRGSGRSSAMVSLSSWRERYLIRWIHDCNYFRCYCKVALERPIGGVRSDNLNFLLLETGVTVH